MLFEQLNMYAKLQMVSRRQGRTLIALGSVLVGVQLLFLRREAMFAPVINDVFTDREDVPAFVKAPHAKPSDYVVGVVAASYADVQPLVVSTPPAQAFDAALAAAKAMPRWEVVHEDREGGVIEAVATTAIMRFRDDVVIRLRPDGAGGATRIDMRSKSRLGKGDLGCNAQRIREYFEELKKLL